MNNSKFDWAKLPSPSQKRMAIHVKPAAERAIKKGHPWVFDQAIIKQSHEGQSGDLAVIFDKKRRFIAIGLYDPDSPIRIKILHAHKPTQINQDWFLQKIKSAFSIRDTLQQSQHTNAYRLIYGENDGLPALIVDKYADTLVIKLYSSSWFPHLRDVINVLQSVIECDNIILRLSRNIQTQAQQIGLYDGQALIGNLPKEQVIFLENGLTFSADVVHGHKTGYFFDQRDNRERIRQLTKGKTVLDIFSYSGGFSVYAASGGATHVTSVDLSAPALAHSQENMQLNKLMAPHITIQDDAFKAMEALAKQQKTYDVLIVDPPSFAKRADEVDRAIMSYQRLARLATPLVAKNGVLVMASCSSRIRANVFFDTITNVIQASRSMKVIDKTSHALDHPITFDEGEYLKCLFAQLD